MNKRKSKIQSEIWILPDHPPPFPRSPFIFLSHKKSETQANVSSLTIFPAICVVNDVQLCLG